MTRIESTEAAPVSVPPLGHRASGPHARAVLRDKAGRPLVRRPADAVALVAALIMLAFLASRAGTVTQVEESYHAFGGEYGGLWRRLGRAPNELVGIGFAAQGFERATH